MNDNMQISPIARTKIPLEGRYKVELFDLEGNLADSQEVQNTIMYEVSDGMLNFMKFATEYGSTTNSGTNRPRVMDNTFYSEMFNALGLYTQKPSKSHKRFLPAIPVGASFLGNNASASNTFQGSHNVAQSSCSFADGYMIVKDVFEFSTSQANGTINALGMFKRNNSKNWLSKSSHVPYCCTALHFAPYMMSIGVPKVSATSSSNALYNAKKNVRGRAVNIVKKQKLSGVESYIAGLSMTSAVEATQKDLIFHGMLMEDEAYAFQICFGASGYYNRSPLLNTRKITVATGAVEEGTFEIWDKMTKLKKYFGTTASDTSAGYINCMYLNWQARGFAAFTIYLDSKSSTNKYPRLYADGTMTPNVLSSTTVYGIYDFNTDSWVIEPDVEDIRSAIYYSVGSTSDSTSPKWASAYTANSTSTSWELSQEHYAWCTGELEFERFEDVGPVFVVNPRTSSSCYMIAPMINYSSTCAANDASYTGPFGYIHDRDLGLVVTGNYVAGTSVSAYKSLVHLDSPVVKTEEYTMKVTYTVSIKVPNMYGKPGHEYEFDLDEA